MKMFLLYKEFFSRPRKCVMYLFSIIFSSSKKIGHFLRNNNNGIESILIV